MHTIFDRIVKYENDYTALLQNLFDRQPLVLIPALRQLAGIQIRASDLPSIRTATQERFFTPDGRAIPDLLIESDSWQCLVEVKVNPGLSLTPEQQKGYHACFAESKDKYLAFLVPDHWRHRHQVGTIPTLAANSQREHTVTTWRDLIETLTREADSLDDSVSKEVITFLKKTFEAHPMTIEEKAALEPWPSRAVSAYRKLESTLQQAKKTFESEGFNTYFERNSVDEHGFYLRQAEVICLWIGIWSKAPTPLSIGYLPLHHRWAKLNPLTPAQRIVKGYHVWGLPEDTWDDPNRLVDWVSAFLETGGIPALRPSGE